MWKLQIIEKNPTGELIHYSVLEIGKDGKKCTIKTFYNKLDAENFCKSIVMINENKKKEKVINEYIFQD